MKFRRTSAMKNMRFEQQHPSSLLFWVRKQLFFFFQCLFLTGDLMIFGRLRNEISAAGDEQLTQPDIKWSHEKNGTFFFYATGNENKNKHSHKRLYSSFYHSIRDWSSDSLRFVSCSDHQISVQSSYILFKGGILALPFLVCTA